MRLLLELVLFPVIIYSQVNLPYKVGEYLAFDISFAGINVGIAEMEIQDQKWINNASTFHIVGKGKTSPFFDFFFKVRDVYETYLDTSKILPIKFVRDIYEGGYEKKQEYIFSHSERMVFFEDSSAIISNGSQDMLSALFFARTFNREILKQKKSFFIPIFMDEENYLLEILYLHNEQVETYFGKINCMVFKPKMQEGRVFQDGEQMKIWISDDKNRLLIKVETEIWAGTIKALLAGHRGLKYPLFNSSYK